MPKWKEMKDIIGTDNAIITNLPGRLTISSLNGANSDAVQNALQLKPEERLLRILHALVSTTQPLSGDNSP